MNPSATRPMNRGFFRHVCVLVAVAGSVNSPRALADQIMESGGGLDGVKVVGFEQGALQYRAADGSLEIAWINEIRSLSVDRTGPFLDFNEAENYAAKGDSQAALIRYRRAQKTTDDFWPDFIEVRILRTCDRPEMVEQAAASFVRVVRTARSGVAAAARLIPASLPVAADAKVQQAIEILEAAISKNPNEDQRTVLELFRFEILRRLGDGRAAVAARKIATRPLGPPLQCERAYAVVLEALKSAMADGASAEEWQCLDAALRDCSETLLVAGLLLKGNVLLAAATTREDFIRASWPFLRVAIHRRKDAQAAEGLLGAAAAMEKLQLIDKAKELLEECIAFKPGEDAVRREAESRLARLRTGSATNP